MMSESLVLTPDVVAAWALVWCLLGLVFIAIYAVVDAIATRLRGPELQLPEDWTPAPRPYPGCLTCEAIGDAISCAERLTRHQEAEHSGGVRW